MSIYTGNIGMKGIRSLNALVADVTMVEDVVRYESDTGYPILTLHFWTSLTNIRAGLLPEKIRTVIIDTGTKDDGLNQIIDKMLLMTEVNPIEDDASVVLDMTQLEAVEL